MLRYTTLLVLFSVSNSSCSHSVTYIDVCAVAISRLINQETIKCCCRFILAVLCVRWGGNCSSGRTAGSTNSECHANRRLRLCSAGTSMFVRADKSHRFVLCIETFPFLIFSLVSKRKQGRHPASLLLGLIGQLVWIDRRLLILTWPPCSLWRWSQY